MSSDVLGRQMSFRSDLKFQVLGLILGFENVICKWKFSMYKTKKNVCNLVFFFFHYKEVRTTKKYGRWQNVHKTSRVFGSGFAIFSGSVFGNPIQQCTCLSVWIRNSEYFQQKIREPMMVS